MYSRSRNTKLILTEWIFFQFAFEGKRGESYQGDIALDDLRVLDGSCPLLRKLKFLECFFSLFRVLNA